MMFRYSIFLGKSLVLTTLLIFSFTAGFSNNQRGDSLLHVYNNSHLHDTIRLKALHDFARIIIYTYPDSAYIIANKQLDYAKNIGNKYWEADALKIIGIYFSQNGDTKKSLENYFSAIEIYTLINDKEALASTYSGVGHVYSSLSDYSKALNYFFRALKMSEEISDKITEASTVIGIGNIYVIQEEYPKAEIYFKRGLKIGLEISNKQIQVACLIGLGNIDNINKKYNSAIEYYSNSLETSHEINDKYNQITSYGNLGSVYYEMGDFEKGLHYTLEAIKMCTEIGEQERQCSYLRNVGMIYIKLKKYQDAEKYLNAAQELAYEIKSLKLIEETHFTLFELFETINRPDAALANYKKHIIFKDSINNTENIKKQTYTEIQYEFDKKEMIAKVEQEKKDAITLEEKQQQQVIVYITSVGLLVFLLLAVFIYRGYSQKKKLSLNLAYKNREITDSINYAQKIQLSILPNEDEFKTAFPDSFVLYKPKDIVSGDFYWISIKPLEFPAIDMVGKDWKVTNPLIAAVDCTGHGVPGSLMSMLGNSLLNKIVDTHKIGKPNEILGALRTEIINSLKQHGTNENKDGMDISLCAVNDNFIEFAGANNPIYIIRKNGSFEKIKGDKMPIGYTVGEMKPYTNHKVDMEKGDCFYIFTDGYPDQFGGADEKKFKYKQLEELLISINSKPMKDQKEILNETIEKWKGAHEQTDDILIIGVRV